MRAIKNLEEIFNTTEKIVAGKVRHRRIRGELKPVSRAEREAWLKIAQQTATAIQAISENLNEKENLQALNQLENLIQALTNQ